MSQSGSSQSARPLPGDRLPRAVLLLGLTIFVLTTSEFMVAGMMPAMATAFDVTIPAIGYLISLYAIGMAVGGPLATVALMALGLPKTPALTGLLMIYVLGGMAAAAAPGYPVMAFARVVTGAASAACFGVSLTIAAAMVPAGMRGRAASVVLSGLMLAPVVGLPATTAIQQAFGWRASFWSIAALAAMCTLLVALLVPTRRDDPEASLRAEIAALRTGRLWAAYVTSGFIIGATFSAFSYATPLFVDVTRLPGSAMPFILAAYGVANVLGNIVVGRFADRHTIVILVAGLAALASALLVFALTARTAPTAVLAFLVIGLCGVPLNPAMVARVMRAAHPGPLVNTVHTSVITAGLAFGAWAGGIAIDAGFGLTAPLWIGFALAVLGLLSLAPRCLRQ